MATASKRKITITSKLPLLSLRQNKTLSSRQLVLPCRILLVKSLSFWLFFIGASSQPHPKRFLYANPVIGAQQRFFETGWWGTAHDLRICVTCPLIRDATGTRTGIPSGSLVENRLLDKNSKKCYHSSLSSEQMQLCLWNWSHFVSHRIPRSSKKSRI